MITALGSRSGLITQGAFVLMCLAVTAAGLQYIIGARNTTPKAAPSLGITTGSQLPKAELFNPTGKAASLILALSTECRFCTESLPFYQELTQLDPIRSGRVQLSIGSAQPIDEMRLYLKEHGLGVAYILGLRPTGLRIAGTPTIVLADSRGLVLNVWRGLLNRDRQKDVVGAVVKLGGKAGL